jgi:hypothetical protein
MSVRPLTVTVMDTPVVSMEALWPDLPEERRTFEVVVTVAREDGGELPAPRALPPEVRGGWSAGQITVKATVRASSASRAVAVIEALVPELTRAVGATMTVRAPSEAEDLRAERGLALATAGNSHIVRMPAMALMIGGR